MTVDEDVLALKLNMQCLASMINWPPSRQLGKLKLVLMTMPEPGVRGNISSAYLGNLALWRAHPYMFKTGVMEAKCTPH